MAQDTRYGLYCVRAKCRRQQPKQSGHCNAHCVRKRYAGGGTAQHFKHFFNRRCRQNLPQKATQTQRTQRMTATRKRYSCAMNTQIPWKAVRGSDRSRCCWPSWSPIENCRSVSPEPCEMAAWPTAAECLWNWALSSNLTRVNLSQILTNHFRQTWKGNSRRPLKRGKHSKRHKSSTRMKRRQSRCTRIDGCLTWKGRCPSTASA